MKIAKTIYVTAIYVLFIWCAISAMLEDATEQCLLWLVLLNIFSIGLKIDDLIDEKKNG